MVFSIPSRSRSVGSLDGICLGNDEEFSGRRDNISSISSMADSPSGTTKDATPDV